MKKLLFVLFTALCLSQPDLTAQMLPATPAPGAGVLFRELTFDEALKVAKAENKLIFMDCYTTWCGPCKTLANVTFKDSLLADYFNRQFINLKVDMEKGEGIELRKKYEVSAYPTLLFIDSKGEVFHRLVGADKAPSLLKKVQTGLEGGGLSSFRKQYEEGARDSAFIFGYVGMLASANQGKEAGEAASEFLSRHPEKMLESELYFAMFYRNVHDVESEAFNYVVAHRQKFDERYENYAKAMDRRLLADWIGGANQYLKSQDNKLFTLDEKGLDTYVARMKKAKLPEASWIGESIRQRYDGMMNQWSSYVKRGEKLIASKTTLGDNFQILSWATLVDKKCPDAKLRQKVARWCDEARQQQVRKDEEAKKNLAPGVIPAISMIDFKARFEQLSADLKKPMKAE